MHHPPQHASVTDGRIGISQPSAAAPLQLGWKRVVIVTSPKAGSGRGRDQVPRLMTLLQAQSLDVKLTTSITELSRIVDESLAADTADELLVIAAGGDGTLSLVAEHVTSSVTLMPMPLGTENLLARYYGFTAEASQIVSTMQLGRTVQLDAGTANGKLFLVVASAGFDAEVVRGMHLTRSGHIRRFSYARPLVRALRQYAFPDIQIRVDGEVVETSPLKWAMLFNLPRYAASLAIEPDACGDDGELDLIGFQRGSVLSGFRYVGGVFCGVHRNWSDVVRRRGQRFELTANQRVPYQLDGDYVGRLPLVIQTLPGRVRLRVPAVAG